MELEKKAEKRKKDFFGGSQKWEDSGEMLNQAGNFYKIEKAWQQAGKAYENAAACFTKSAMKHNVINALGEAANVYRKNALPEAIRCLGQVSRLELEEGNLQGAARAEKLLAELAEEASMWDESIEHYEKADELFRTEEQNTASQACQLKVAFLCTLHKELYGKGADLYERAAAAALQNNLTRFSAKDYFFRAGICRLLLANVPATREVFQGYILQDPTFQNQRECKLLFDMLEAFEKQDPEKFTSLVYEYDSMTQLDQWKTALLLKVKTLIAHAADPT